MAEVQDVGHTNLLKRSLPDTEDAGLKRHRVDDGVEADGETLVLQELDEIGANINEILERGEKEKERITRETSEAVQQRLQHRAGVLEQLPGFWAVALRQSLARDYITEDDDKLLEYLVSVDVAEVENLLNITLRFAEENPYLVSTEITRQVHPYDPNVPAHVSPVAWRPGQELSPAQDDSGAGTFDSCNFFQRITCLPTFDTVDQILHTIFWDPMKYYNGTADLDAERMQHQFVEEVEDDEGEVDEEHDYEAADDEQVQDPAAEHQEGGSEGSEDDAGSDGDDGEEELNVDDQDVEEEEEEEVDVDGDDGDAL